MLSFRTGDDWTSATLTVDSGGGPTVITLAATSVSAYDAMQQVVTDVTSAVGGTWSWSWASDSSTRGAIVTLTGDVSMTLVANATAQSLLGFSASYGSATTFAATAAAQATLDPAAQVSIRQAWGVLPGDQNAGGAGACRQGVPGASMFPLRVESALTALETGRLQLCLDAATNPRQAWGHQEHIDSGTWRLMSVAGVNLAHNRAANLWGLSVEAIGGIIDG